VPLVSNYNGFIFDYGGVLVSHQTDADHARMAKVIGVAPDVLTEFYWINRCDYDRDTISGIEYWTDVARRAGKTINDKQIEELIDLDNQSWMQFDEVMWDWIAQLHAAGKRVAMLSNMPRDLGEALRATTDRLQQFDAVTLSYEVRAIKPEPAIYEHCLEGLGLPPKETLFLDDRIANVQGAEMLGIDSIEFLDRDDVLLRIRS
jgi:putative hydrolase of the HAD superfamily